MDTKPAFKKLDQHTLEVIETKPVKSTLTIDGERTKIVFWKKQIKTIEEKIADSERLIGYAESLGITPTPPQSAKPEQP